MTQPSNAPSAIPSTIPSTIRPSLSKRPSPLSISATLLAAAALFLFTNSGCGKTAEIAGGTRGTVRIKESPLADVYVTAYRDPAGGDPADAKPLGIAITDRAGGFALRTLAFDAPLWLEGGTYRFTIESAGEVELGLPKRFADPAQTPFKFTIRDPQTPIDIVIPKR